MSLKGVTYSIKYDDDYTNRYDRLLEIFNRFNVIEDRTTSCVFLETNESVDNVHTALYGALDYEKDKAIVFETYRHSMKKFGPL